MVRASPWGKFPEVRSYFRKLLPGKPVAEVFGSTFRNFFRASRWQKFRNFLLRERERDRGREGEREGGEREGDGEAERGTVSVGEDDPQRGQGSASLEIHKLLCAKLLELCEAGKHMAISRLEGRRLVPRNVLEWVNTFQVGFTASWFHSWETWMIFAKFFNFLIGPEPTVLARFVAARNGEIFLGLADEAGRREQFNYYSFTTSSTKLLYSPLRMSPVLQLPQISRRMTCLGYQQ